MRGDQQVARFVLQGQNKLHVGIGPIDGAPIDVAGLVVHVLPGRALVGADADRRAVHQRRHQPLALAGRIEQEAAGPFGAALRLRGADSLERLALVGGAIEAAVADVDDDVAGCPIDQDAAEAAEAGLLGLDEIGDQRLPFGGGSGRDQEEQTEEEGWQAGHGYLLGFWRAWRRKPEVENAAIHCFHVGLTPPRSPRFYVISSQCNTSIALP